MVPGVVSFKGTVTGNSFGIISFVFAWSDENRQKKDSEIAPDHPNKMQLDWGTSENGFSARNSKKMKIVLDFLFCLAFLMLWAMHSN